MLSIVIPVYNEEGNIKTLVEGIVYTLEKESILDYEIIVVDDGSEDNTFKEVKLLHRTGKNIKVIKFNRNFGKSSALSAGFDTAKGDIIITMDGDLQDIPEEIPRFIDKINEGYDLVIGWRKKRKDTITKRLFSRIYNILVRVITNVKVHDSDCNYRAFKRDLINELVLYGGLYRYIPSIIESKGYKITEIEVKHMPRKAGKSKYGITNTIKGFLDLITVKYLISYRESPSYLFGSIGLAILTFGISAGGYLLYLKYMGNSIGHRPLLMLCVLLIIMGIQFISFGLIADMFMITRNKDNKYRINEILK